MNWLTRPNHYRPRPYTGVDYFMWGLWRIVGVMLMAGYVVQNIIDMIPG